ncbi:MAG: ribosomal RNA small subunit methyltransferase A [bacterium]|nr:MAG: ribosomal RNA small subunit methyltransferase A [bacterium]
MIKTMIYPKKSLGQNFLKDENIARKIISSLSLNSDNYVLEIGPGTGVLTKYLIEQAKRVVAVEIDKKLVQQLLKQFYTYDNLFLYHDDILKISFKEILIGNQLWKVVANLPYHITSPVLFKLFDHRTFFDSATLMIQKEVAQRIVAQPKSKNYSILSVFSQLYAEVKILFEISHHVFLPKPEVSSAVVRWDFKHNNPLDPEENKLFRQIVKGSFGQRRKMLRNSLRSVFNNEVDLTQIDFDLEQRPEDISVQGFIELTRYIKRFRSY